jgi:multidrug resistance efflux pump
MRRKLLIPTLVVAGVIILLIVYSVFSKDESARLLEVPVEFGTFEVVVSVTGELQAKNSTEIRAPVELRNRDFRFRSIKIQDLIPEGTIVDSGDYVATLDRSEADNNLKDVMDELETIQSQYTKTKLDTTMSLRNLRDELINLKFATEEAEINLEQSQFEPPATIRQAKINLDRATRAYEQAQQNYKLKVQQAAADMTEITIELAKQTRRRHDMEKVINNFVITAPASGMIVYKREWNGEKRTVGTEINTWDLTVATLPDLSSMISKTYVNEIDISRVKVGQQVRIGVDAFPEKKFTGVVTEVANIGEQLPNTDSKVFEVVIKVNESDPIIKPSMTTSNSIIIKTFENVLYIPLETVHTEDSLTFVYKKNGIKQVVVLDESNENEIIVEAGLKDGEKIMLSVPDEPEKFKFEGLELASRIREKEAEKRRIEKEQQAIFEEQFNRKPSMDMPGGMSWDTSRARTWQMPTGGMRDTSRFNNRRMNFPQGGIRDTSRFNRMRRSNLPQGGIRDTSRFNRMRRSNLPQGGRKDTTRSGTRQEGN